MSAPPRLRPDLIVRRLSSEDEHYVILKDPETQKVYKFEAWEGDLFHLLDGTHDIDELVAELQRLQPDMSSDAQSLIDYLDGLRRIGLLERTEQERHLAMMDRMKTFRKKRFYDAENSTLLQILIPLFDPNRLMDRVIRWIRWWWSPWFVVPWVAVFAAVLVFLGAHWDLYWASFFRMLDVSRNTAWDWTVILFLVFATGLWHELGHGFTCKRFGGEVHDIGLMIFYMQPAFYCGTEDAYLFPDPRHRMYVAFGGAYFEMMLCSAAMPLWLLTPSEWWIHEWALIVVLTSGLSLIVFNLNPLIKLDGYYVLMDWLDIPTLREDSFEYIGRLVRKNLLHMEVAPKPIPRRRRRIYLVYGACSVLYTGAVVYLIYDWLRGLALDWFGPAGYAILFAVMGYYMRKQIRDTGRFMKHLWIDKREFLRSRTGMAATGTIAAAALILLLVPRTATRIDCTFRVEPAARSFVRAPAEGFVRLVNVREGDEVRAGDPLGFLEAPDLLAERDVAAADRETSLREAALAHGAGDAAVVRERLEEAGGAGARLDLLDATLGRMALLAPIDGVISTPDLERMPGRRLAEGDTFCAVDRLDTVRLDVSVPEMDIEEIRAGTEVRILATSHPERTLRSHVLSVAPVAHEPEHSDGEMPDLVRPMKRVRVLVEVDNEGGRLRPGASGRVQFLTRPRSAAVKVGRQFYRWAASVVW